jgi:RecA-family ATPase
LPEKPFWISGGVLPKSGILLMGGEAKIGKTFLDLDLAHALGTGGKLWGTDYEVSSPTSVHYFEQEVGEIEFQRRIKMRYDVLGEKPPENLFVSSRVKGFFLDTGEGQKIIARELEATKAKVAIIDPIGRCMLGNENDNMEVGGLFRRLDELLISFPELSFVISHHFGKPPREDDDVDPLSPYRFRGASKWFDAPDTLVTFMRLSDHPGEWRRLKGRITVRQGEPPEGDLKFSILPGGIVKPTEERDVAQVVDGPKALRPMRPKWGNG